MKYPITLYTLAGSQSQAAPSLTPAHSHGNRHAWIWLTAIISVTTIATIWNYTVYASL